MTVAPGAFIDTQAFLKENKAWFDTKTVVLNPDDVKNKLAVNDEDTQLLVAGLHFSDVGYKQFLTEIGIPAAYGKRVPATVLQSQVAYMLGKKSDGLRVEVLKERENVVRCVGEFPIKESLEEFIDFGERISGSTKLSTNTQIALSGDTALFQFVDDVTVTEPRVGDTVASGVQLFVNRLKNIASAAVFTTRLSCINGATATRPVYTWQKQDVPFNEFIGTVQSGYHRASSEFLEHIKGLANIPLKDLTQVRQLLVQFNEGMPVSTRVVNLLADQIRASNVNNMYDLWNIITAEATHGEYKMAARMKMQNFAGFVAETAQQGHCCKTCGNNLI